VPPVSIIDSIVGVVVLALGGFVAWLVAQVRALKAQAVYTVTENTPEKWHWLWRSLAVDFVKAVSIIYEDLDGAGKLREAEKLMYAEFDRYGFVVDESRRLFRCGDCGAYMDAFDYVHKWAAQGDCRL